MISRLILLFIFLIQSTAWSITPEGLTAIAEDFNASSKEEKWAEFATWLDQAPESERAIFLNEKMKLIKLEIPKLKVENGKLTFALNDKKFVIDSMDSAKQEVVVNGELFQLTPNNISSSVTKFEALMTPKTGLTDFIIAPAYAYGDFGLLGILFLVVVLIVVKDLNKSQAKEKILVSPELLDLTNRCTEVSKAMRAANSEQKATLSQEIASTIKEFEKLAQDCAKKKYKTTECENVSRTLSCFRIISAVDETSSQKPERINTSSLPKEVPEKKSSPEPSKSKTKKE